MKKSTVKQLQYVADVIPDMICIHAYPSRHIIYCNAAFSARFGAADVPPLPDAFFTAVHPGYADAVHAYWERFCSLPEGEIGQLECRARNKLNEWVWLHIRGKVFGRDADGAPLSILHTLHDITPQKNAEQELTERNQRLSAVQELGHIGDFYFDPVNNSMSWSDELYKIMGIPPGKPLTFAEAISLYSPADREKLAGLATDCLRNGSGFEMNAMFCPSGQLESRYLYIHAFVVKDHEGNNIAIRGIVQDVTERKRSEQEILRLKDKIAQKVTDKYYSIFNSVDEGFCIIEMIYDQTGAASDYRFVEVNPAFENQTGLKGVVGKFGSEVMPGTEPYWIREYDAVARTGQPVKMENYHAGTGRWYLAYASRIGEAGGPQVAIVFSDITQSKETEARQAFLLALSDAIRAIADPVVIEETITQLAMHYFNADRCYYCTIADGLAVIRRDAMKDGLPSVAGTYPLESFALFKKIIDQGGPLVVHDVRTAGSVDEALRELCIALQVISFIDVPVIKNGKAVGILCIVQSVPRNWTGIDIQLAVDTAERTWAAVERATAEQALQKSEAKYRNLFSTMAEGFIICEMIYDEHGKPVDWRWLEVNPAFEKQIGLKSEMMTGRLRSEVFPEMDSALLEKYADVVRTQQPVEFEEYSKGAGRWLYVRVVPFGQNQFAVLFGDIDERKKAEGRKQFLLNLSDALRPLADPVVVEETITQMAMHYFDADRCYYCTIAGGQAIIRRDAVKPALPSVAGIYPLDSFAIFKKVIEEDAPLVIHDVNTPGIIDEALRTSCVQLQAISFIGVPVIKNEETVGILCMVRSAPYTWTEADIRLVVEIAERTWDAVQRATTEQALHDSQVQLGTFVKAVPTAIGMITWKAGPFSTTMR